MDVSIKEYKEGVEINAVSDISIKWFANEYGFAVKGLTILNEHSGKHIAKIQKAGLKIQYI